MKAATGKRFCRLLEAKGWELKRVNGSYHIYAKADNPARISVPVHGNNPLKIGLQRHLMKVARIDESELQCRTCRVGQEPLFFRQRLPPLPLLKRPPLARPQLFLANHSCHHAGALALAKVMAI